MVGFIRIYTRLYSHFLYYITFKTSYDVLYHWTLVSIEIRTWGLFGYCVTIYGMVGIWINIWFYFKSVFIIWFWFGGLYCSSLRCTIIFMDCGVLLTGFYDFLNIFSWVTRVGNLQGMAGKMPCGRIFVLFLAMVGWEGIVRKWR